MGKLTNNAIAKAFAAIISEVTTQDLLQNYFPTTQDLLENHLITYGESFVERLQKYGVTEKNEKLILYPWVVEFAKTVGDLRIHRVLTAGNAQCGKSLINTLFLVDFLVFTGLNTLWFYPSKQQVDSLVPELFGKVVKYYVENVELDLSKRTNKKVQLIKPGDRTLASRFQVKGATAIFSYASNSAKDSSPTKQGLATVGTAAASVSASIMFIDERSQIPPEAVAVLPRRIDAGRIPTQPIREVGTFGAGIGIESVVEQSKHHFYPHVECEHCGEIIPITPKGSLLKADENGKYLSENGRPKFWHYKDENNKIESAYFACPHCFSEISTTNRMAAFFKCLKSNVLLSEFLQELPQTPHESYQLRDTITIHLSPLLRNAPYNLAARLIDIGLNSESVRDYQQQVLGFSSEADSSRVTKDMIEAAKQAIAPNQPPDYTLMGVDQGRQEDYVVVVQYWLNTDKSLSTIQQIEQSFRKVIYCKPINRNKIAQVVNRFTVQFGFIDNEPDRQSAYDLSQTLPLVPADQRRFLNKLITEIEVSTGGIEIKALAIDNVYFQDMALNSFASGAIAVPDSWDVNDKSIYSPTRHFMSVSKDDNDEWQRAKDNIDDFWFAYVFCEASFYWIAKQKLDDLANKSKVDWYRFL